MFPSVADRLFACKDRVTQAAKLFKAWAEPTRSFVDCEAIGGAQSAHIDSCMAVSRWPATGLKRYGRQETRMN